MRTGDPTQLLKEALLGESLLEEDPAIVELATIVNNNKQNSAFDMARFPNGKSPAPKGRRIAV